MKKVAKKVHHHVRRHVKKVTDRRPNRIVNITKAVVAFGLAYAAASWAIDSGRLWAYFITTVLLLLGLRFITHSVSKSTT